MKQARSTQPPSVLSHSANTLPTFRALTRAHLGQIVAIQLRRLGAMLAERGLTVRLTDRARDLVAEAGYDPAYGARPLKRAIQQYLQNPLALALPEGKFQRGMRWWRMWRVGRSCLRKMSDKNSDRRFGNAGHLTSCSTSSIRNGRFGRVKLISGAGMRWCLMSGGTCWWCG